MAAHDEALRHALQTVVGNQDSQEGDVHLSDSKIRQLVARVKGLTDSNARLRRRVERVRSDEAAMLEQNRQLARKIDLLQETYEAHQRRLAKKDPLRLRLAGPVEKYANRAGEKWPAFKDERRKRFPAGEAGASIHALKQIFPQIFDSVADACNFFNTSLTNFMTRAEIGRGIHRLKIKNVDPDHVMRDIGTNDSITCEAFMEIFDWNRQQSGLLSESRSSIVSARETKPRRNPALKWREVGSMRPETGTEIENEQLQEALQQRKLEFTRAELERFEVSDLESDSYIKVGDTYFKPATQRIGIFEDTPFVPNEIEASVSEALRNNPEGWDAMKYISNYKAAKQAEREAPKYDPEKLIDMVEPEDVRLLSAREKFMIRHMRPPNGTKFVRPKRGEQPWTERLTTGWKNELEEGDPEMQALREEHEARARALRKNQGSAAPNSLTLDLTGLKSPRLPEQITFRSNSAANAKVIKPHHLLKDGFTFSADGDNVRRLMREHEAIMSARRPIMSAVTADHAWLKQQGLLLAVQRKEGEERRAKEKYDLDGRCYPAAHPTDADTSMEQEGSKQADELMDAAVKDGDHAALSAILKRRENETLNQSSTRDPYEHASPANIAYMQVQESANSGTGALVQPKDDPALKRLMDHISAKYPRGGSVASKIKAKESTPQPPAANPRNVSGA